LLRIVNLVINPRIALALGATSMLFSSYEFILVFLPLALAGYFGLRLVASKSAILFLLTGAALTFYAVPESPVLADQAEPSPGYKTITSPILDAISQNTPGQSEGYAVGVPRTYAWCSGSYKPPGYNAPPSNFTAVTGWGAIYPKVGAPAYSNPDGSIIVANAKTYVHLTATQDWILVQDQAKYGIAGAHFVSNFSPKATAVKMRLNTEPDGSVAIGSPPPGYNDHFWLTKRGTYPAGSVDGVYVQMEMRTTDPEMKFVANVGADWWRDATADFMYSFVNNPGAGMSNWVELSTQWSTLRFYSWSTSKLLTDPPPPLAEPKPAPVLVRRLASTSPPCLSPPKARRSN
jgi:hypothetical protein